MNHVRCALGALVLAAALSPGAARAQVPTSSIARWPRPIDPRVFADGRDHWSLLRHSTVNRDLRAQADEPRNLGRLLLGEGRFVGLADGTVGWQQPLGSSTQTRFHGYYVLDTYIGFRLIEQLELTANLTVFNPSASDGYRTSADILPGLTIHVREQFDIDGVPLRVDVVGFDLDVVTTGAGLFFEQLPVEGWMLGVRYCDFELRGTFGGRGLFADDNFIISEASWLDRTIGLTYLTWFGDLTSDEIEEDNATFVDSFQTHYLGAFANVRLTDDLRVAGEYAARVDTGSIRSAAIARVDWRNSGRLVVPYNVHLGYQARMYLNQFGPRGQLIAPTQTPNTPRREDVYVTNSFEYFQYTPLIDQWSHTVMMELDVFPSPRFRAYGQAELWHRAVDAAVPRVVVDQRFGRFPDAHTELFYRLGVDFFIWPGLPHRFSIYGTNKAVIADTDVRVALPNRLDHRHFLFFEGGFQL